MKKVVVLGCSGSGKSTFATKLQENNRLFCISREPHVHEATSNRAKSAVNQLLTIRNWAIGYYIVEFEQNGKARAEYGSNLLEKLEYFAGKRL